MKRVAFLSASLLVVAACRCGERTEAIANTVAECIRADGDVRFHPPRDVVWQSVARGHRFALGDWVRTAESARAEIRFDSGTLVEMEPASTVIIETVGGEGEDSLGPLIALESGSLRGSTEKGVSRRVSLRTPGGERVSLSPEKKGETFDYRVSVRGSGEVELAVTSGAAEVQAGASRSVLRAGEASVMKGGRLSETERLLEAPKLTTPVDGSVLAQERGTPTSFSWTTVAGAARYRLEASSDPEFRRRIGEAEMTEPRGSVVLPAGAVYWRVSAISASGLAGASSDGGRFEVREKVVHELLFAPPDGVEVEAPRRRARIEFAWKALEGTSRYELVVSKDKRLDAPVLRRSTEETRVVVNELSHGQYHWGVFAEGDPPTPLFREPFRLRIRRGAATLEAPNKLDWR